MPGELGRVYRPTVAINASPSAFAKAFAGREPKAPPAWEDRTDRVARRLSRTGRRRPKPAPARCTWGRSWSYLEKALPEDAIICNGAGNFATWIHRFHRFRRFATQGAPTSGSMGYGSPAGVGAKEVFPDREVIVWAGDGDFLMHGQEFATAVQYNLPIVVVILEQRHLRHDPHASGARLSRPRLRHRPEEPRLRSLCPRLRRPRRDGGDDRGLRAGLRARPQKRQAGYHRGRSSTRKRSRRPAR